MNRLVAVETNTTTTTRTRMIAIGTDSTAFPIFIAQDPTSIPFVAKLQKARTRKNKNYFILRTTIPKNVTERIGAKAGDYLFFKAKKAEWYHMLDWNEMSRTWQMLPDEIRNRLMFDGLYGQGLTCQPDMLAGTNLAAPQQQLLTVQQNPIGEQ